MKKFTFFLLSLSCVLLLSACTNGIIGIPEGEFISSYPSPNHVNTVNIYLCNGGATVDYAIRGELKDSDGNTKNIYWEYHCEEAEVDWESDDTVVINERKLNVNTDVYDFRNE